MGVLAWVNIMSTAITRILKKLSIGRSEAGHISTDDRGNNVWTWDDEEAKNAKSKTALIRKLDANKLTMADTQMWKKDGASNTAKKIDRSAMETDQELKIVESPTRKKAVPAEKQNRFGKPTDNGGGFNPYG